MPQYTAINLSSASTQLALRLQDPNNKYWPVTQLYDWIRQSLRMYQCLTAAYRERATFNTIAATPFYNLRTVLPTQYPFTITDTDLYEEIQAHLLEPVGVAVTGTGQFTGSTITNALQSARDQFLLDTGIYLTRSLSNTVSSPPVGRVQLAQTVIDIRRLGWRDIDGVTYGLTRDDEYAYDSFKRTWTQTPARPESYSIALTPPVSIQLEPPPIDVGQLDMCILSTGPALNPSTGVALGIPNDFCWAVKYGAMADILGQDGAGRDPIRAAYCQSLYNLGVECAKAVRTVLQVHVNDIPVPVSAITDWDLYRTSWQNTTWQPTEAAMVGPNLLTFYPVPDDVYGISVDMVRAMPVPADATPSSDYLQVSESQLNAILDLAQHIASFQMAGSEFNATLPLRDNFLQMCGTMNARLKANVTYNMLLSQPATRQDQVMPRLVGAGDR